MRIAIYSRGLETNQYYEIKTLLSLLATNKIEPIIFQDFFNQFYSAINIESKYSTFNSADDLDNDIDCLISLGGDGTLLDTVTLVETGEFRYLALITAGWFPGQHR
jgi:NAD+ kinase